MRFLTSSVLTLAMGSLAGCASSTPSGTSSPTEAAPAGHKATVTVEARSGSTVSGTVVFEEVGAPGPDGLRPLRIHVAMAGLAPGDHGFHVHQKGDCSDPKGDSAGPHFDIAGHPHAGLHDMASHAGDLGNLTADADGKIVKVIDGVTKLSLSATAPNGIVGRAIVVHDKPDDLTTQPSGASGPRIGCGVIALDP